MKEQDNIVNNYKNTTIELSKLDEREKYNQETIKTLEKINRREK